MADTSARDSGECRKTPQGAAPISRRRPSMDPDERARAIHDAVVSLFVDGRALDAGLRPATGGTMTASWVADGADPSDVAALLAGQPGIVAAVADPGGRPGVVGVRLEIGGRLADSLLNRVLTDRQTRRADAEPGARRSDAEPGARRSDAEPRARRSAADQTPRGRTSEPAAHVRAAQLAHADCDRQLRLATRLHVAMDRPVPDAGQSGERPLHAQPGSRRRRRAARGAHRGPGTRHRGRPARHEPAGAGRTPAAAHAGRRRLARHSSARAPRRRGPTGRPGRPRPPHHRHAPRARARAARGGCRRPGPLLTAGSDQARYRPLSAVQVVPQHR